MTIGLAFDLAIRRRPSSLATTVLVVTISAGLLASGRLETRHSRLLVASAPLFAIWAAVRASPWLIPLDLVAASGLLMLGMMTAGDRRLLSIRAHELAAEPFIIAGNLFGALPFLRRGLHDPEADRERTQAVINGLLLMVPVVIVLGALLATGDALAGAVIDELGHGGVLDHVGLIAVGTLCGIAVLYRAAGHDEPEPAAAVPRVGSIEAAVVLAGIAVLYALFAALQVAGALGAADSILDDPGAITDWARQGFFQLLWAAGITLGVLVTLDKVTRPDPQGTTNRSHRWLRVATAALTLVIVAMSVIRIARYSEAFGLTMLRLYSMLFAGWIAVVFALYAARSVVACTTRWLAAASAIVGLTLLFALNVANPEAIVARYDMTQAPDVDVGYLTGDLSPDAIPAIAASLDDVHPDVAESLARRLCAQPRPADDGWLGWNRSRSRARAALASLCEEAG